MQCRVKYHDYEQCEICKGKLLYCLTVNLNLQYAKNKTKMCLTRSLYLLLQQQFIVKVITFQNKIEYQHFFLVELPALSYLNKQTVK